MPDVAMYFNLERGIYMSEQKEKILQNEESVIRNVRRDGQLRNVMQQEFITKWNAILSAQRYKEFLYGTVSSVTSFEVGEESCAALELLVDGTIKATIPFNEIFRDGNEMLNLDFIDTGTERGKKELLNRQKAFCERMYGLEVPFLVKEAYADEVGSLDLPSDYFILGSRKDALLEMEKGNFSKDRPRIQENDLINATVVTTGYQGLAVNVAGVDVLIPANRVTARYMENRRDLENMFTVGQDLPVIITQIQYKNDGHIELEVDPRGAHNYLKKPYQGTLLKEGQQCLATISNIVRKDAGKVTVFLYLDQYDMAAFTGIIPSSAVQNEGFHLGDIVRVTVIGFTDDGMVYVRIRSLHQRAHSSLR